MISGVKNAAKRLFSAATIVPRWVFWLSLITVCGAALRIVFNNVTAYSPADEGQYLRAARLLADKGWPAYPGLVTDHLSSAERLAFPPPVRWGYLGMAAWSCAALSPCDGRSLAWLSTLAGVASIIFTYLAGARLVGQRPALLAAALSITSPLQLALSRRALADEVFCAVVLATLWALLRLVAAREEPSAKQRGPALLLVLLSTLAFAVKEAFVVPYAAFAAVLLLAPHGRARRLHDVPILLAPPLLYFLGFWISAKNAGAFGELLALGQASFSGQYSFQYQSGPPHRPLFDLFLLAPIVSLLSVAAVGRIAGTNERDLPAGGERLLAFLLVFVLTVLAFLPKNVRFAVIVDPVIRLLAGWTWLTHLAGPAERLARRTGLFLAFHAAAELALFHRTFIAHPTYDPTTYDLLLALGAVPRRSAQSAPGAAALVLFIAVAIAITALLVARRRTVSDAVQGPGVSKRERAITIGVAAACVVGALLLGRSCGQRGSGSSPAASVSAVPTDPATAQVAAGIAARDPEVAIYHFRKALELRPEHYGATFQLARSLDLAGRKDEALGLWERVLALATQAKDEPLVEMAKARLAEADPMARGLDALYTKRDPVAAAARFREVLAVSPDHYGATFQLATALTQAGKAAEARPVWEKMLRLAEAARDAETANAARARLLEIERTLGPSAGADPDAADMQSAVDLLHARRDAPKAVEILRKILQRSPDHYGATYQLAVALDQAGKPAEARAVWEKVAKKAEAAGDARTLSTARERLSKKP